MCFRPLLNAVFHRIRIVFEGSKLKIVDQKAYDGRVSQIGFQFLRWLQILAQGSSAGILALGEWLPLLRALHAILPFIHHEKYI